MQAVAHNKKFAKKVGVPTKVGKEFTKETKMKKYRGGGMPSMKELEDTAAEIRRRDMSARRKLRRAEPMARGTGGEDIGAGRAALRGLRDMVASPGEAMARASRGVARGMPRTEDMALKTLKEMYGEDGLLRMYNKNPKMFSNQVNNMSNKIKKDLTGMKKGGEVKKGYHKMPDGKIMKNSAHKKTAKCTRGDGCAKKGKTKGRMV